MNRLILFVLLILLNLSSFAGIETNINLVTKPVSVIDFTSNAVTLQKPAQRIIALAPHLVEDVFSAGAGKQLVGVVEYSNYPEQALALPSVGGYGKVNLEAIVELEPDLILGWASGNQNKIFQKIRNLGIPLYIDNPKSLEDVARVIKDIGVLSGNQKTSREAAHQYLNRLSQIKIEFSNTQTIDVFYQVWDKPLYTINGEHIISNIIKLCGGNNIYADESILSPVINLESVIDRNPQVIIASGMGEQRPEWLEDWKKWPQLIAVQKNNLYFVHPDLIQRHTTRILDGAEIVCNQLRQARENN